MADQITPVSTESEELRAELDRSREEVLRLRDLLIAKDAELGKFKGEVEELRGHVRLLHAVAGLVSRVPGLRRAFAAVLSRALSRLGRSGA